MNFKPEQKHIFPELFPEISSLTPTVWEISREILAALAWISPASAQSCWDYEWRDIEVSAQRYMTIQRYQVWDWKNKTWFHWEVETRTDITQTLQDLTSNILNDNQNQRIVDEKIVMQIEFREEDWESVLIPLYSQQDWLELSEHIWESCSIKKSILRTMLQWKATVDDIEAQCFQ
jgi:hypothetical protein